LPVRRSDPGSECRLDTDASGAELPHVRVTLSNKTNGLTRSTTTDSSGRYEFLTVPVASEYKVDIDSPTGFKKVSQTNITLFVNQNYRADFRLQLGSVEQIVDVSANPVQVETSSTQLGEVIDNSKIVVIPLNCFNYLLLLSLQV